MHFKCSLLLALIILISGCSRDDKTFDSAKWKAGSIRTKGMMVDDLLKRGILLGKSRKDVETLLGKPDGAFDSSDIYKVDIGEILTPDWWYVLKICYKDGQVTKAYITD